MAFAEVLPRRHLSSRVVVHGGRLVLPDSCSLVLPSSPGIVLASHPCSIVLPSHPGGVILPLIVLGALGVGGIPPTQNTHRLEKGSRVNFKLFTIRSQYV